MPASEPKQPKKFSLKGWWKRRRQKAEKRLADEMESIHSEIEKQLIDMTSGARFLKNTEICQSLALLDRKEIQIGNLLGEGSFCEAFEITGFKLQEHEISPEGTAALSNLSLSSCSAVDKGIEGCRQELKRTVKAKNGRPRYALKQLSINLFLMQTDMQEAAVDLILEANFLMRLDHPNILKIRGMALGGSSVIGIRGIDSFFVVIDRLTGTLDGRIDRWKREGRRHHLYCNSTILNKARDAIQIAYALAYLHRQRIIFRE
jgi:serine/threonine protein kinase